MTTGTDVELVARTGAGDDEAYGELYRRYRPAAHRRAYRLVPCGADADDLVSDAFVTVLAAIRRGHRPDHFRAYLLTTIRHRAARLFERQRGCRIVSLDDDHGEFRAPIDILAVDADPADWYDTEPVRQAFRALPPRWRLALWLSTVEARTPTEVGSLLGLTPNGAAALTCRARRGLRRAHTEITAEPPSPDRVCPTQRHLCLRPRGS